MPKTCPACRSRLIHTPVDHYRIDGANGLVLYQGVRRYNCPRCQATSLFDYRRAHPVLPGDVRRPIVRVAAHRLHQRPDFNDYLLILGLAASFVMFAAGVSLMPLPLTGKLVTWALLLAAAALTYAVSIERLEYSPSVYTLPTRIPAEKPGRSAKTTDDGDESAAGTKPARAERPAKARPAATAKTADRSAGTATVERESAPIGAAAAEPAAPAAGDTVRVKVHYEGTAHELDVRPGEILLMSALDRNVNLEYSCLEGMCDSCLVKVLNGMNNLSDPTREEVDMLGDDIGEGFRLACQAKVRGPVEIKQGD